MNATRQKWSSSFNALPPRERGLVAVAVLAAIVFAIYGGFIDPALKRARTAEREATEQRAQLVALQAQQLALQAPDRTPDARARAELASLNQRLGELAGRFVAVENALVPPQRMPDLLEEMIGRNTGLRLISLKTLPVTPLLDDKAAEGDGAKPSEKTAGVSGGLFKHGVEIRLQGSYAQLAAYLERLEKSKMKLIWSRVALSAENHPKLVLTLTVYTLSLDRAWLIV